MIAFNGQDGVRVDRGLRNALQGNAIWGHGGLGIRLVDGGNNNQAAPLLSSASVVRRKLAVSGSLRSAAQTAYALEFFASATCHPAGAGEGAQWLGAVTVTTDGVGEAVFVARLAGAVPRGWVVTATATDPQGNTSAFSTCVTVVGRAPGRGPGELIPDLFAVGDLGSRPVPATSERWELTPVLVQPPTAVTPAERPATGPASPAPSRSPAVPHPQLDHFFAALPEADPLGHLCAPLYSR